MTLIEKISKLFRRVFNKEKSCCAGFAHPRCDGPQDEMKLASFMQKIREEEMSASEHHKRMDDYMKENQRIVDIAHNVMFPSLRKANRVDYIQWLEGFVDAGNTPTHYYSYPFSRWNSFYVAKKDFELVPLYGADSINIIVPEGITILGGSRGHNNIFCYNGYKHRGTVPVFSDTVF